MTVRNEVTEMRGLLQKLEEAVNVKDSLADRMERKESKPKYLPVLQLSPEEKAFVSKLPKMSQSDLWPSTEGKPLPSLLTRFGVKDVPSWFVLDIGHSKILVSTEGYDYCRYAAKLE